MYENVCSECVHPTNYQCPDTFCEPNTYGMGDTGSGGSGDGLPQLCTHKTSSFYSASCDPKTDCFDPMNPENMYCDPFQCISSDPTFQTFCKQSKDMNGNLIQQCAFDPLPACSQNVQTANCDDATWHWSTGYYCGSGTSPDYRQQAHKASDASQGWVCGGSTTSTDVIRNVGCTFNSVTRKCTAKLDCNAEGNIIGCGTAHGNRYCHPNVTSNRCDVNQCSYQCVIRHQLVGGYDNSGPFQDTGVNWVQNSIREGDIYG
jgi:hypothetical protein